MCSPLKVRKHIERKYHLIREIVNRGDVAVSQIASEDNLADPFINGLSQKGFLPTCRRNGSQVHRSMYLVLVGDF